MKKFFIVLLLSLASIAASQTVADVYLTWANNPAIEFVSKYVVYQATGDTSSNYVPVVTVTGTNFAKIRVNSTTTTYKFKVMAVNGAGNAPLSEFVKVPTNAPTATTNLSILKVE